MISSKRLMPDYKTPAFFLQDYPVFKNFPGVRENASGG
jgi:hypothetical protein